MKCSFYTQKVIVSLHVVYFFHLTPTLLLLYHVCMPTNRKLVFVNDFIYHIFNRTIDHQPMFNSVHGYKRFINSLDFYRFDELPVRFSHYMAQSTTQRQQLYNSIKDSKRVVEILAFALMPNHFHLILVQKKENGLSRFVSKVTNSFTKYYNTKNDRLGPIFESVFKAKHIESDDQLVHLSRYIHLNPVAGGLIHPKEVTTYPWTSMPNYLSTDPGIIEPEMVLSRFKSKDKYQEFVLDYAQYSRELHKVKYITFD